MLATAVSSEPRATFLHVDLTKVGTAEWERERADRANVIALCAFCPKWRFEGSTADARVAATDHRARFHPVIQSTAKRSQMTHRTCKVPGCANGIVVKNGRYAGMCETCRDEKRELNSNRPLAKAT